MKDPERISVAAIATTEQSSAARSTIARYAALSLAFALAMVISAHVRIPLPFSPVPLTLQTFVVLMAGLCLGSMWGGLTQVQYLTLGLLGVPAFAGGPAALVGPTGGYLVGMVFAAVVVGVIYAHFRTTWGALAACIAGHAVIFTFGCAWLGVLTGRGALEVLAMGFFPFVPGLLLKTAAAVALVRAPYTSTAIRTVFNQ